MAGKNNRGELNSWFLFLIMPMLKSNIEFYIQLMDFPHK